MPELPYKPEKIGSVYNMTKATVYGFAYHDQTIIALSVQAPTIQAEQLHYKIQGQDHALTILTDWRRDRVNRTAYPKECHFEIVKTPIPDTSEVSMILLNDALYRPNKDMKYTYAWHRNTEAFKRELFFRVREIVYVAVETSWADFLYVYGSNAIVDGRPLCGRLPNRNDTNDWISASFDIGFIRNDREAWERLISRGLEEGMIQI